MRLSSLNIKRTLAVLSLAAFMIMNFQNCAPQFKVSEDLPSLGSSSNSVPVPPVSEDAANLAAGRQLYTANCASCHGNVDSSTKLGRTASLIQSAISSVSSMRPLANLSSTQVSQIARALSLSTPPVSNGQNRATYSCNPALVASTPMMKLTNREYRDLLLSTLDTFGTGLRSNAQLVTILSQIPSDIIPVGRFTNKEQPFLLTNEMGAAYFEAAFQAATLASTATAGLQNYPNTNGCLAAATVTQACHQLFVRELASRAFRKSLTAAEGNSIAATMWDATLAKAALIQLTYASILQLPDSMYKVYDGGVVSPRGARVLSLTAHELATKLSYLIVGQAPDTALKAAADSAQILDPVVLGQQVDRLFALPAAQETIRRLFREAYGYDRFSDLTYTPEFLDGQNITGIATGMIQEMDYFFPDLVLSRNGTFRDLMTSQNSLVQNQNLGQIYGITASTSPVTLPAQRGGFLSRAAMLTKRSGNFTSPIKRGLFVLENVLCESVGNPPPDAPTMIATNPVPGQYMTTRERYAHTTEAAGTSCTVCHSRINHLGHPFENFDSLGRFRVNERIFTAATGPSVALLPVDTRATSPDLRSGTTTPIQDSMDLSQQLANNDKAMMCFAKTIKSFEAKVSPTEADNCQMNETLNALYGTNGNQGSIKEAIKRMVLSNDFRLWSY